MHEKSRSDFSKRKKVYSTAEAATSTVIFVISFVKCSNQPSEMESDIKNTEIETNNEKEGVKILIDMQTNGTEKFV